MNSEKPKSPVPETYKPPTGKVYHVTSRDSWVSLARGLKIDPWQLIDFNFPGMKQAKLISAEHASRQVNWYLAEYVGCRVSHDGGKNLAFSDGLTTGRGVHKGGVIFLPPAATAAPAPPPPAGCGVIEIPPLTSDPRIEFVLKKLGARLPEHARCLDPLAEVAYAKGIYGNSLAYDDIYVSDGVGASNRPFTLALPYSGGRIVVLNLGPSLFSKPGSDKSTLIHELAHAWQSQHHADPSQFMMNCVKSQAAAAAATTASRPMVQVGLEIISPALPYAFGGPASAYAYVPGQPFGNYGGEQIAQQVEDFFFPPRLAAPPHVMSPSAKAKLMSVRSHMIALPPGKSDPENVRGLNSIHFAYKAEPNVVWHDFD